MALTDVRVRADTVDVATSGYMTVQPSSSEEWDIHNLTWSGAVQVQNYDGTRACTFHVDTASGGLLGYNFHLTNTDYLRVYNPTASSTIVCHYDGVLTYTG